MFTTIPPSAYHHPEIYAAENRLLAQRCWWFVGFRSELELHHSYVTRMVGGISILVQNFHGDLAAFVNTCSHRFSRIHCDSTGVRPLQCPYHGWAYNAEGLPVGIPSRPRFEGLTDECREKLRLQRFQVDVCGQLVFVAHPEMRASLNDYLGECGPRLEEWTNACGHRINVIEMDIAANWKILVENTLESYHVGFVHPKSFARLGVGEGEFRFDGCHSNWTTPVGEVIRRDWKPLARLFSSRAVHLDGYAHQLIFPNLMIATTWGASFSFQIFEAIGPGISHFTSYIYRAKLSPPESKSLQGYDKAVTDFNRTVFEEDRRICEEVQKGVLGATGKGILSSEELRVQAFHHEYMNVVGTELTRTNLNARQM